MSALPRATARWESELPSPRASQQRAAISTSSSAMPARAKPDTEVWVIIASSMLVTLQTWIGRPSAVAPPPRMDIFNGGTPRITPGVQRDLAAWAAKVALMLDAYEPGLAACSSGQYRWMYQHHTPPPDWYVWIGAFAGSPTIGGHH